MPVAEHLDRQVSREPNHTQVPLTAITPTGGGPVLYITQIITPQLQVLSGVLTAAWPNVAVRNPLTLGQCCSIPGDEMAAFCHHAPGIATLATGQRG